MSTTASSVAGARTPAETAGLTPGSGIASARNTRGTMPTSPPRSTNSGSTRWRQGNPPLLTVSDMTRFSIRTNWTNSVSATHDLVLDDIAGNGPPQAQMEFRSCT